MAKDYTAHQRKVINNYYKNRDSIALQRVQELVTELYLAEGKKRDKVWEQVASNLEKLEVKQPQIDHLRKQNKPELLAEFIKTKL
jgi:hypothetical protein